MNGINPVRTTTERVVETLDQVKICDDRIEHVAKRWVENEISIPEWPHDKHLKSDNPETMTDYLFLLDSLNFCFWSDGEKWQFAGEGKPLGGYFGFSRALRRFFNQKPENACFEYLARIERDEFEEIFSGNGALLLMDERFRLVQELAAVMVGHYNGKAINFLTQAGSSAENVVEKICAELPGFEDKEHHLGNDVFFRKRAQILVADLYGAFGGKSPAEFTNIGYLTAFPDYKLPQILKNFDIFAYAKPLIDVLRNNGRIGKGSMQEIELRSATVQAVERLTRRLCVLGMEIRPYQVDWILWNESKRIHQALPYHRTETIAY